MKNKVYGSALEHYAAANAKPELENLLGVLNQQLMVPEQGADKHILGQVIEIHVLLGGKSRWDDFVAFLFRSQAHLDEDSLKKIWDASESIGTLDRHMKLRIADQYLMRYVSHYPYQMALLQKAMEMYKSVAEPFPSQWVREHAAKCFESGNFSDAKAAYDELKELIPLDVLDVYIDLSVEKDGSFAAEALKSQGVRLSRMRKRVILGNMATHKTPVKPSFYLELCEICDMQPSLPYLLDRGRKYLEDDDVQKNEGLRAVLEIFKRRPDIEELLKKPSEAS